MYGNPKPERTRTGARTYFLNVPLHALYHNMLGRIYLKTKKESGFRNCIHKESPLFAHLAGLLSCILFGKNIGRMIVKRIKIFCFLFQKFHTVRIPIRNYSEVNI